MGDFIAPVAASDPTYCSNGIKYSTHDEEMIARRSILVGPAVIGSDPEAVRPFTDSFIADRALIWEKMVAIFQRLDAWSYLEQAKKNYDGIMGYKIIYNHHLGPSNIYNIPSPF